MAEPSGGASVGSVSVDVDANLAKLDKKFAEGRRKAEDFNKSVNAAINKAGSGGAGAQAQASAADRIAAAQKRIADATKRTQDIQAEGARRARQASQATERANRQTEQSIRRVERAQIQAVKANRDLTASQQAAIGVGRGFVALMGTAAAAALARSVANVIDFTAEIGRTAKELNISTDALQEWRYAGQQMGVTASEVDGALRKFTSVLGKAATGSVNDAKLLQMIGFSMKEIKAGSIDANEGLSRTADFLSKIKDPAQRAAVEMKLFGESGGKLDALLSGGSAAIDRLREAAHRLGGVLGEKEIQEADQTARKLDDVKVVLQANIARTVAQNAASIVGLANAIAQLTGAVLGFLNSNPAAAMALMGGLAGGRVAGLPGAAVGAVGGYLVGDTYDRNRRNSNTDPAYRLEAMRTSRERYRKAKEKFGSGAFVDLARKELQEQIARGESAVAAARATRPAAVPGANGGLTPAQQAALGSLNAPAPARGRKGREDNSWKDRLRDQFRYDQDIARAQLDELREREELAVEVRDKGDLASQQLAIEKQMEIKSIELDVALGDMTAAQGEKLKAMVEGVYLLKQQNQTVREDKEVRDDMLKMEQEVGQLLIEGLEIESSLAQTAKERRAVELRILDAKLELEKRALQAIIDDDRAKQDEKQAAMRRMSYLDKNRGAMEDQVRQSTAGPLEAYRRTLPDTADKLNEQLENVAVKGLGSIEDGLMSIIDGTKSVGAAFRDMASGIVIER